MHNQVITKAAQLVESKAGYGGDNPGMSGYAVLSLVDEAGYPTSSANTISTAKGIHEVVFLTGMDSNKVSRI